MPRERSPDRDKAKQLWIDNRGKLLLKDIASELGVGESQIRKWKSQDKWEDELKGVTKRVTKPKVTVKQEKEREQPPIENDELSEKQRLFIFEYLRDFNATRSAIAVGYNKKTAYNAGWMLLRKREVQGEIKRQTQMRAIELGLDVNRIIAELMKIAFADISDISEFGQSEEPLFDEEGNPLINPATGEPMTRIRSYVHLKNADEIDASVIAEVKKGKDGVSVKLHDKMRALEKLERYMNYMTEEEKLRVDKLKAEIKSIELKGF